MDTYTDALGTKVTETNCAECGRRIYQQTGGWAHYDAPVGHRATPTTQED